MSLAFDTCVLIDILRGRRPDFRDRLLDLKAEGATIHLSSLVVHELYLGVFAGRNVSQQSFRVTSLIELFELEPWNASDAVRAAVLRAHLKSQGTPIGPVDVLIAGQALDRGWTLVTSNVREFERVEGLEIENWAAD